ncbi:MAG TPA: AI-2E family transporter [Candidatus Saccharimonadales bacterium]|nr:AI-2E family transporter [Candidatus Saccharimonadales bacterium]
MKDSLSRNHFLHAMLIALGLYILWRGRLIVLLVFIAFLFTTIVYPLVAWLKKHHWPTALAILTPIVVSLAVLGLLFYVLLPPFFDRMGDFAQGLPKFINSAARQLHLSANTSNLSGYFNNRFGGVGHFAFEVTTKVLTIIGGILTIIVLSVYWLASYETVRKELLSYFHGSTKRRLEDIWSRIELKLRHWIKAHLILNTVVGLLVWICMLLAGVPFAGLLALIAFLVEIIPTAGPLIAATPAIVLGLSQSLLKGVVVALIYIIIQQIESHILSPLLLGRTVRLHPIVIIIALLIGFEVYGILGAFIAVPVTLCISSVIDSFKGRPRGTVSVTKPFLEKTKTMLHH